MHLTSSVLAEIKGIQHGFGSRDEEIPEPLQNLWERTHPRWRQVHGTAVVELPAPELKPDQRIEADAFWTERPGFPAAVVSADCVPILLARRDGARVGAIHAGWRGTLAKISECFFNDLSHRGESPTQWFAAIGPAIGPCCYEVSEELSNRFSIEFQEFKQEAVPHFRHLDLPKINEISLKKLGLPRVDLIRACTRCSLSSGGVPLFNSFRRMGAGTRQYSIIAARRAGS